MTRKLEQVFNLPETEKNDSKKSSKETNNKEVVSNDSTLSDISELDKIDLALPAVKGLGTMADNELNDIADRALTSYQDLMDLGMNVEVRYSGRIFEVAGGMLKTSLDAKVAKLDKKMKMVDLQLKKEKAENKSSNTSNDNFVDGNGHVVTDRNSLIERLKGMDKDK